MTTPDQNDTPGPYSWKTAEMKKISGKMFVDLPDRHQRYDFNQMIFDHPFRDHDEDQIRLAAIEDILTNGSANMSPRHVAETVLKLATQRMDYRTINQLVSRHASSLHPKDFIQPRETVDLEQHVAECCEHTCKFNDFECAIVNGTATADMPCEEGDHL